MKEYFIKSLQMIKVLGIEKQYEYQNLTDYFLILSIESLKYISQKDNFSDIVELAKRIE